MTNRGSGYKEFIALMAQGLITVTWFWGRQPETLPREKRMPFSVKRILNCFVEVCTNRLSLVLGLKIPPERRRIGMESVFPN